MQFVTIARYCSIVMTSHWPLLQGGLPLALSKWFGWWQSGIFSAFLGFSSEDLGFLDFYCVAVIEDTAWFIILLISASSFFALFKGTSVFSITDEHATDTV